MGDDNDIAKIHSLKVYPFISLPIEIMTQVSRIERTTLVSAFRV